MPLVRPLQCPDRRPIHARLQPRHAQRYRRHVPLELPILPVQALVRLRHIPEAATGVAVITGAHLLPVAVIQEAVILVVDLSAAEVATQEVEEHVVQAVLSADKQKETRTSLFFLPPPREYQLRNVNYQLSTLSSLNVLPACSRD